MYYFTLFPLWYKFRSIYLLRKPSIELTIMLFLEFPEYVMMQEDSTFL
jgi:hypothetical protein